MNPQNSDNITLVQAWLLATRPKTLPAALAPVIVGSAMAATDGSFAAVPALAALAVALLMQIGVNLANDYFDFIKGIDSEDRLGPLRVAQSGLIPPTRVKSVMIATLALATLLGIYLMTVGGWPVALIGAASILAALAYSGGPFPLASHGLGDLFVFIFFGLVAVCGTYYVQALRLTPMVIVMASIVGLLITAILVVNNLRDIQTDRSAGKHTLAVIIGPRGSKIEYALLLTLAYLILLIIWLGGWVSVWGLLPLISLPLAVLLTRAIWKTTGGPALNRTLAGTAKLALIFSAMLACGLLIQ